MKNTKMLKKISLVLILAVWSSTGWAKEYIYQGTVDGMVCAFCAYNVSKKISTLPGIISDSVNVDLKNKLVDFRATTEIKAVQLSPVFSETGFSLSGLTEVSQSQFLEIDLLKPILAGRKPAIKVVFVPTETDLMELKLFAVSGGM